MVCRSVGLFHVAVCIDIPDTLDSLVNVNFHVDSLP